MLKCVFIFILLIIDVYNINLKDSLSIVEWVNSIYSPSLQHTVASNGLSVEHTGDGKHGKAAVLQLTQLNLLPGLLIGRSKV